MKKITKNLLALALLCTLNFALLADSDTDPNSAPPGGEAVPDSGSTVALLALASIGVYFGSRFAKRET